MAKLLLNNRFILSLIIFNALLIFLSGFNLPNDILGFINILDLSITLIFAAEIALKIRTHGVKDFFSGSWNKFDFALVLISLPSLLTIGGFLGLHFDLSFLLVFRILRVVKLFRFFSFIKGINNLLKDIKRGVKASVLILATFTLFIFVVSILSNNIFGDTELFKDPFSSLYATFQVFTIEGWNDIPEKITAGQSETYTQFTRLYFSVILLVGGIFGLSFVNAVLVDTMVADNNDDLEKKIDTLQDEIKELKDIIKSQREG